MKRILIALAISLVLTIVYYFIAYIISPFFFGTPPMTPHSMLYAPISLPASIYQAIAPDAIQNLLASNPTGGLVERLIFIFGNVVLFAVPMYILSLPFFRKRDGK